MPAKLSHLMELAGAVFSLDGFDGSADQGLAEWP
jgi:hypothetical protein